MFQKSKFLVFNTLVCAMTIASGASASPIPQPIPGERQNGGDPVLVKFIEGVGIATLILDSTSGTDWTLPDHIPPELIRKGMDRDSLTGWVATHHEELLEDLRGIEVGLATAEQTSCAQTSSEPKSKVIVSSTLCAPQIVDSSAAAWVLLGEAAHHVDAANRETWSQAEENVFAAFITLSARMSFEAFRITPQNLVRQYQCEKASLQSNSIKLAITQLNLLGVKRIVEEGFPIWNGLVDKNCKVTASATSIAAGSQYLIEIGAKPDSVNKTMVAFEILRYVIEKSGAWDIEISGKIFDGFRNGYKSSVVASYGKVIDSIYVFYLNGRHDSGFSSTVFADYVLTYNRDNLLDLLSTVRDEIDYPSMIAKLFLYGPKVSDSLVLFLQSQGVDFESTWASDLCETLLGEVILTETARYNTAALLSQGVKPGEANKPKLVLKAVNLLRSIDVNNPDFFDQMIGYFELARQAGLDLNAPYLKSPDLKEGRNLIDWVYILEQMYRTGAKIHRDLGIHRREIADYGGNRGVYGGLLPESYFHDATIMLERADKLAKLFKYLIQSGFKPTGIPVSLFIPGPHEGTNSHTLTYGVFTYLLLELQAGKTKNLLGPNIFDAGYLSWPLTRDDFVANKIRLQTLTFAAPK